MAAMSMSDMIGDPLPAGGALDDRLVGGLDRFGFGFRVATAPRLLAAGRVVTAVGLGGASERRRE